MKLEQILQEMEYLSHSGYAHPQDLNYNPLPGTLTRDQIDYLKTLKKIKKGKKTAHYLTVVRNIVGHI